MTEKHSDTAAPTTDPGSMLKMTRDEAKRKAESVADDIGIQTGGAWQWINDRQLRVYGLDGQPLMTFTIEDIQ